MKCNSKMSPKQKEESNSKIVLKHNVVVVFVMLDEKICLDYMRRLDFAHSSQTHENE